MLPFSLDADFQLVRLCCRHSLLLPSKSLSGYLSGCQAEGAEAPLHFITQWHPDFSQNPPAEGVNTLGSAGERRVPGDPAPDATTVPTACQVLPRADQAWHEKDPQDLEGSD